MLRSTALVLAALLLLTGAVAVLFPQAPRALRLYVEPAPAAVRVPVAGVALRDVHGSWGNPRPGGRRHEGIDIFAPRGRAVLASTHGIVWRVGVDRLGGHVVVVLGPGRQLHYYAHLDRPAARRPGEWVEAGSVLGVVGDSGNARGGPAHLHYGIYPFGGPPIDPYPLLAVGEPSATAARDGAAKPHDSSSPAGFMGHLSIEERPIGFVNSSLPPTR